MTTETEVEKVISFAYAEATPPNPDVSDEPSFETSGFVDHGAKA